MEISFRANAPRMLRGFARQSYGLKKCRCPIIVGHRAANGIFEREIRELAHSSCNFRALRAAS